MADILIEVSPQQQAVLRSRAEDLARSLDEDARSGGERLLNCLFFQIQGIRYAVAQDWVQEVHLEVKPTPVPCTPGFVRGIVNVRGDIVSAVDLSSFLGFETLSHQASYQMFRLRKGKLEFGVLCDQIENIQEIDLSGLHPFEHADAARLNRFLLGVTQDLVNVLDVEALMADESLIVA